MAPSRFSFGASASPTQPFSFGATAAPTPPPGLRPPTGAAPGTPTPIPAPAVPHAGPDALAPIFQALAQAMQQQAQTGAGRLALQGHQTFGKHLGTGGGEVTPTNPTGNLANPWASEGLFHGGMAGQLTPEGLQASQGNSAMSQRAAQGQVPGVDPAKLAQAFGGQASLPSSNPLPVSSMSDPYAAARIAKITAPQMTEPPPMTPIRKATPVARKGSSFAF